MNQILDKIKCYSFNKQDFIIVLSVYNATYLVSSNILKGHLIVCFVIAVLLALIALFIIAWIDLVKKTNEEEAELEHEQNLVRKKIKDEYIKVHKMKRKNELLMKAGCLPPEHAEKTIVVDHDDPPFSLNKDFKKIKEVHFNYIDNIVSDEKNRGQPEGT